jgi:molybdopterin-guanine dinucleotide biosynthesis protein A
MSDGGRRDADAADRSTAGDDEDAADRNDERAAPASDPRTAAVILAGGTSSRFGDDRADKALADLCGVPMVDHVAARLAPVVDEVVVNCRPRQTDAIRRAVPGATLAVDPVPDRGPLYGIRTGLRATSADRVAVVACDLPLVDPTFVDALVGFLGGHDAAVPRREDGWFVPTLAAYRRGPALEAADAALAADDARPLAAVERLSTRVVEEAEAMALTDESTFLDVNTEDDLAEAERLLRADERLVCDQSG